MTWTTTTWGDVCNLNYGKTLKGYKHSSAQFPVYGSGGVIGTVNETITPEDSVIVSRKGTLTAYWSKQPSYVIDTAFWLEPSVNLDAKWSYYAIKDLDIATLVSGSGVPSLSRDDFYREELLLPPLAEQKAIASVLSVLDDKIENNLRMNETLEGMARAIFKSWFVNFDPVRAKMEKRPIGLPDDISDLFPNERVNSEIGQIPKGWKNITVGDLIVPKRGKTITKSKTIEGVIPVVAGGLEPAYFHNQSNVDAPVITISASGANAGFTRLYNENIWASDCSYISRKQTDTLYFWYVFLKTYQKQIYHMQQGAAQPHIYPSDLMRLELCVPLDEKLIQYFERLVLPYFQRISIAQQESKTLAELRDMLLPKLISGEIRVADAERKVEAL